VGSDLLLTFSENVAKGTGNLLIKRSSDNAVVQTIDVTSAAVSISGATVTINPADFVGSTGYYVEIPATAFKDLSNNAYAGISGATAWNFTTADTTAPTVTLSATSAAENAWAGTVVGTLSATDPDGNETFTYLLVSGVGGDDGGSFAIDGNQLKTAAPFDFEAKSSYSIRVRATNQGGLAFEKVFTISVTDGPDTLPSGTTRVNVDSNGTQSNGDTTLVRPRSLSADGRYFVFQSSASNLVSDDTNGVDDVFVRDLLTGTTSRVSAASNGTQGNAASVLPSISADGRYVAFRSSASNLVSGDNDGNLDIFVRDLLTGAITLVSVGSNGTQGNANSDSPSISSDGRYVAFNSHASNLISFDTNGRPDVFVRDLLAGTTTRVSVDNSGTQGDNESEQPSISQDGRYVAFQSSASNLVSGDTNGIVDTFVRDLLAGTTTRANVSSNGTQGNSSSFGPSISMDGRYVVFQSSASNLVSGDTNEAVDVFVRDLLTGTTSQVSVGNNGTRGNNISGFPSISGDGRYVAFQSSASNLVSGDTNETVDIFVRDLLSGTTNRLSEGNNGTQGNNGSYTPAISADGRYVAFQSFASNLVSGDTNGVNDVFVRALNSPPTNIALSATSVAENLGAGTVVGTLSVSDPDAGNTFTYDLVSGSGSGDNASYSISGNQLKTAASFNFEVKSSYSIRVRVTDQGGLSFEKVFTINVTNVTSSNDAPTLVGTSSLIYKEGQAAAAVNAVLAVGDLDHTTLSSATVRISANYIAGEDVLEFVGTTTTGNITGSFDPVSGTVTLQSAGSTATLAQFQAALRLVKYSNASFNPTSAVRTVSYQVSDGTLSSNVMTSLITVVPANNAPTVSGTSVLAYTEKDAAQVINPSIVVADVDSALVSATVRISANNSAAQDVLGFVGDATTGNIIGSFSGGSLVLISPGGTATVAQFQAALRRVTYVNTSANPSTLPRSVTYQVSDGTILSTAVTSTINITSVNDAPTLVGASTLIYTPNQVATAVNKTIVVADADNTTLASATVRISSNYVAAEDRLGFVGTTTTGNIVGSFNAATGTMTLTSAGATATIAQFMAAIRLVTYQNISATPTTAPRSIQYQVFDSTLGSNLVTSLVTIKGTGTGPVVGGQATTLSYSEKQAATVVNSTVTVSDADSTTLAWATVRILANLKATEDILGFVGDASTGNITGSYSPSTGTLTLISEGATATAGQFQAALRLVTYRNASANPSLLPRSIGYQISDGSNLSNLLTSIVTINS
jgi:Tol biopolymer transport system component